tara:strand:+ start:31642 stop:33168 length:1527 start_codon:yes stop_codon:yes gene_type:complete
MTFAEQIARVARRTPDTIALKFGKATRTYRELDQRVAQLANILIARGLKPGDRVAVLMLNGIETIEAYLAVLRTGAICVPLNFRLVASEVSDIVQDCEVRILICDDATFAVASLCKAPQLLLAGAGGNASDCERIEDIIQASSPICANRVVSELDPAFLMYTSGTTGRPKGALLSHLNLLVNTLNMLSALEIGPDDRVWLAASPLFHIAGLSGLFPFLYSGGTSIVLPSGQFDANAVVDLLEREQVTSCYFVPTQWQAVCEAATKQPRTYALQRVTWGASIALPSVLNAIAETFPGVRMYNVFGQTEMSPITTVCRADLWPEKHGSVGRSVPTVEVRVVDDSMNDVPKGEIGEIVYRGPTTFLGYWNRPEADAEAFAGGWFHSGDMVREDEDGFLFIADRKKDMIISGGENIYPAELEAVIDVHPAVLEVAVIGVPHSKWVETPIAIVVLKHAGAADEAAIIAWCKDRLASYKKPSQVHFIEALPRNASGKVVKSALREEFSSLSASV